MGTGLDCLVESTTQRLTQPSKRSRQALISVSFLRTPHRLLEESLGEFLEAAGFILSLEDYKDCELWHFIREWKRGENRYGNIVRKKTGKVELIPIVCRLDTSMTLMVDLNLDNAFPYS